MKEFVIRVQRTWMLLILPILALAYFLAVVVIVVNRYDTGDVTHEMLAYGGLALFALVVLIELPFFLRRKVRTPKATTPEAPVEEAVVAEPYAPTPTIAMPAAPVAAVSAWDDERMVTGEVQQGLAVLEYSTPAKSRHRNAVYAKAYIPVTKQHVLRVETLAAEGSDL